ncbi:unnamed protein product [Somion occarium]|uniref:C2H2-type domain-containing protein n=1 Tax=Somion occarium TaxID=3059160 RepID=A0ABP1D3W7_9APHY
MPYTNRDGRRVNLQSKRRKLVAQHSQNVTSYNDLHTTALGHLQSRPIACCSCHRSSLQTSTTYIFCPRCEQYTCLVCSRTCEGWSSSSEHLEPLHSQRSDATTVPTRLPLSLTAVNGAEQTSAIPKPSRRRPRDDDHDNLASGDISPTSCTLPGCGRKLCRNCCVEDVVTHLSICHNCYSHVKFIVEEGPSKLPMEEDILE